MKVSEFIKFDKSNTFYRVVDATKVGYLTSPTVLTEADRNIVIKDFGEHELVGFSPVKKNALEIYVK